MRKLGLMLLAASLAIGAAATLGLRLLSGPEAQAAAPALPQAGVVVAARPIGYGEAITPSALRIQPWPAGAAPQGAFRSVAELGPEARHALAPIAVNEPILRQRITGPGGRATLSGLIRPGLRASTIRVDDVMGVAGFVLPGDFVDVLVTRRAGEAPMRTDVLLRGVRVLAVDQMANDSRNDPMVARAATIEVTPEQSQKLALAAAVGSLSLALRGAEEGLPDASPGPAARTIREGDLTLVAAPSAGPARPGRRARPPGPSVQIYLGAQARTVPVARD
ncbi:Flp pilus assembly protein CpaB [Phenylobacterium sp.]|uniref:Flp pilus assembly protein CpaB n=1 Tax=Phenylobacterium sp. TaxID=1871053 RepID=UPI002BA390FD|nr:Flp pilus assembly protein CpaB [Phenylobacterium sp.]HVI31057.1 Flp pilus assembly protein CpaB [Phenylobacterium sp.]